MNWLMKRLTRRKRMAPPPPWEWDVPRYEGVLTVSQHVLDDRKSGRRSVTDDDIRMAMGSLICLPKKEKGKKGPATHLIGRHPEGYKIHVIIEGHEWPTSRVRVITAYEDDKSLHKWALRLLKEQP